MALVNRGQAGNRPAFSAAGKQFGNPGLEAQFCAECGSGLLRHDRHTIALIFILEAILFIAGLFIVIGVPQLNALHTGIRAFYMLMLLVAFFHY